MKALAFVLCIAAAAALQPPLAATRPARSPSTPVLRRGPLIASAPAPSPTLTGSLVAGTYTGVLQFTFAAACAAVVFGPVGLPLSIGIQHVLIGFVLMQTVVTKTTGVPGGVALSVPSFEVLPFLAKFAMIVSTSLGPNAAPGVLLATVLAGSILVNVMSAAFLAVASVLPVDDVAKLLPPPLQAGLFAAIGWGLYLLSFDILGLGVSAASLFTKANAMLWIPANILGIGLWQASRKIDSPLLFPVFIAGTSALVHGVRLLTGTSVVDARAAGWLMAEALGESPLALGRALAPSAISWSQIFSGAAMKQLICAAIFGPLVNTVLNFILFGPMIKARLDLKRELRSHAAGSAAAALVGGYPSYLAVSDTAVHRKIGGLDKRSCYAAAAVGALFLLIYPLCGVVGYIPTLAVAAICIFIGADFLYDSIVEGTRENGLLAGAAAAAVLVLCVKQDMLIGTTVGIVGAQAIAWVQRRRAQQKEA